MTAAPDTLNPAQHVVYEQIVGGPRSTSSAFRLTDDSGQLVGPFKHMVKYPSIGGPLQALGAAIRYETSLTPRAREIAILTVSRALNSDFEAYAHRLVALRSGMTAREVTSLLEGRFSPADDYENEVLRLSESLLENTASPFLTKTLDEQSVAEVVTLVGYYRILAQLMRHLGSALPSVTPSTITVPVGDSGRTLELDFYEAPDPRSPIVLYLHGGGWISGSRKEYPERYSALLERGISVASLDYRLATEAPYPAQQEDIEAAIQSLDAGSRPVFLAGASAGAMLAALALTGNSIPAKGFIGFFGRYDLTTSGDQIQPDSHLETPADIVSSLANQQAPVLSARERLSLLAGLPEIELSDDVLSQLSPVVQITETAPPLLLIHGTGDAVVDHRHSIRFAERAHRLGVHCELVLIPEANHESPVFATHTVMDAVADFVHGISATH